jgi:SAM-dependent methyltransferase
VEKDWRAETASVAAAFDRVADLYRREFADELDRKPFDRALLDRLVDRFPPGRPVLEVGAGPAHIAGFLAERGVSVVASDASLGQLHQARRLDADRPVLLADLARLPLRRGGLGGIVAFYCLIYGAPEPLDEVFADWYRALEPGGVAVIAVHAGHGTIDIDEWEGRRVGITIVLRDPDDLSARLERTGFVVDERSVRPPYEDEHATDRCYIVASRAT